MQPSAAWSVRAAGPADAAALALVGSATFLETYAGLLEGADIMAHCGRTHVVGAYLSLFEDGCSAWLAEVSQGGAPVGFAVTGPVSLPAALLGPEDVELRRIYTLSRFHGTGMGRALVTKAVEAGRADGKRRLLLGVHERNERARAFYAKVGFRPVGRRIYRVGATEHDDLVLAHDLG